MKIVTYNVNGLKQRVSQFGSLRKLLDSLDSDIICFQETKLSKQELSADLAMADGYESFFSCTRTSDRGRVGYSGVATFCRVKSAFSSSEVALPVSAEEGFTGISENFNTRKGEMPAKAEGLEEFEKDELFKIDSEGRCVITDHCHFVLFNIYGPRAVCDDVERAEFKIMFFKMLQKRCESLIRCGRRVFVVGDLNIAPSVIDSCRAGPDFEKNECRIWFRSVLVESGGPFVDVFRAKHPERRDAYTCWPQNTGAEEFNYGSRIDHILSAGSCLHQEQNPQSHDFVTCHVKGCDILEKFKRWKPGDAPRWKGGRSTKLEGSDHAPVCMSLTEIPHIPEHSTPSMSTRYIPKLHGCQQTIVSVLMKRQLTEQFKTQSASCSTLDDNVRIGCCSRNVKRSSDLHADECSSSDLVIKFGSPETYEQFKGSTCKAEHNMTTSGSGQTKKKARKNQLSQLSLRSFFKKSSDLSDRVGNTGISLTHQNSSEHVLDDVENNSQNQFEASIPSSQDEVVLNSSENADNGSALLEWRRIQQLMQSSIPLCKGHKEPCVPRIVKKAGPNYGRRFYVCARAEGPTSNPEANCNFFKWAASKSRPK